MNSMTMMTNLLTSVQVGNQKKNQHRSTRLLSGAMIGFASPVIYLLLLSLFNCISTTHGIATTEPFGYSSTNNNDNNDNNKHQPHDSFSKSPPVQGAPMKQEHEYQELNHSSEKDQQRQQQRQVQQNEDGTCIVGDGINQYEFQSGESFGRLFDPGCSNTNVDGNNNNVFADGTTVDFPCYCNPRKYPNTVDCPYCSFETNTILEDGITHEKVCARHNEQIDFISIDGVYVSCSCHIPLDGLTPAVKTCQPVETPGKCTLQLEDGSYQTFDNGESLGGTAFRKTRCTPTSSSGLNDNDDKEDDDEFPCYCNIDVPGQIYCPYCRLLDYWQGPDIDPFLVCVPDQETVLITDETGTDNYLCTCSVPSNGRDDAIQDCIRITDSPTLPPSPNPSTTPPTTTSPTTGSPTTSKPRPTPKPTPEPNITPQTLAPTSSPTSAAGVIVSTITWIMIVIISTMSLLLLLCDW